MKIISRLEAIALCLDRYCTGEQCSKGHEAERYVRNRQCVECAKNRWEKQRKGEAPHLIRTACIICSQAFMPRVHSERCCSPACKRTRILARSRARVRNRDPSRNYTKAAIEARERWRKAHPEKSREYARNYALKNPGKARAARLKWAAENPDKVREYSRRYQLRLMVAFKALQQLGLDV